MLLIIRTMRGKWYLHYFGEIGTIRRRDEVSQKYTSGRIHDPVICGPVLYSYTSTLFLEYFIP